MSGGSTGIEKEFELPQASVARILKRKLPDGISVAKDAKAAFAKAAGIFIMYLTAAVNECCKYEKRQTLSARDIFQGLSVTQFDEFTQPLQACLAEIRLAAQSGNKRPKLSEKKDNERKEDDVMESSGNGEQADEKPDDKSDDKSEDKPEDKPDDKVDSQPDDKPNVKPDDKPNVKPDGEQDEKEKDQEDPAKEGGSQMQEEGGEASK